MIDQHGWSVKDWLNQTPEEKAILIGSLQYWSEEREKHMKGRK